LVIEAKEQSQRNFIALAFSLDKIRTAPHTFLQIPLYLS
jgi:hypothetical protein